jgi:nucleoside-diphosphate-sugar epimerase
MLSGSKKVLVTGGAGIVGCNVVKKLREKNCEVVVLDNLSAYPFDYLNEFGVGRMSDVEFIRGDIRDKNIVNELVDKVDVVIHAAAYADVGACVRRPELAFDVNVIGTQNVLDAAVRSDIEKFIFVSSASVYGNPDRQRFKESDSCFPISNYGVAKLWGEQQVKVYGDLYGLKTAGVRFFSVYGTPQVPKEGSHSWAVAIFGMRAMKAAPITVFGDGEQIRDFTHVSDIAESVVRAIYSEKTNGKFFNCGRGEGTTINEIVAKISKHVKHVPVNYEPHPPGDPRGGFSDTELMKQLLNWEPEVSLGDGIASYIGWVKENQHLIPKWL